MFISLIFGINNNNNNIFIKNISKILFEDISKILFGSMDYYVTGVIRIKKSALVIYKLIYFYEIHWINLDLMSYVWYKSN